MTLRKLRLCKPCVKEAHRVLIIDQIAKIAYAPGKHNAKEVNMLKGLLLFCVGIAALIFFVSGGANEMRLWGKERTRLREWKGTSGYIGSVKRPLIIVKITSSGNQYFLESEELVFKAPFNDQSMLITKDDGVYTIHLNAKDSEKITYIDSEAAHKYRTIPVRLEQREEYEP